MTETAVNVYTNVWDVGFYQCMAFIFTVIHCFKDDDIVLSGYILQKL